MSVQENTGTSFVTKVVVVAVAIGALISFLMPNTDGLARFDTEINRIFVLSFVQNPEGLYMASEVWENEKRYDFAIREMRLGDRPARDAQRRRRGDQALSRSAHYAREQEIAIYGFFVGNRRSSKLITWSHEIVLKFFDV